MVLHDLFYDRKAKAGAFAARGHIGLGQPLATLHREALAVVLDDDSHTRPFVLQRQRNLARRQCLAGSRVATLVRLAGILQDIGQDLTDLTTIADQRYRVLWQARLVADVGIAAALQEQRLLAELLGIL